MLENQRIKSTNQINESNQRIKSTNPCSEADPKAVALLLVIFAAEGSRNCDSKNFSSIIDNLNTIHFWYLVQEAFIDVCSTTLGKHFFQDQGSQQYDPQSIFREYSNREFFNRIFKQMAENCGLENQQETILRDVFIANRQDTDGQRELLKEATDLAILSSEHETHKNFKLKLRTNFLPTFLTLSNFISKAASCTTSNYCKF